MDKLSELMIITMEECGELTQARSKVLRKRENQQITREPSKQSLVDLTKEVADVMCMIDLMKEQGLVNDFDLMQGVKSKRDKLKIWSKLI